MKRTSASTPTKSSGKCGPSKRRSTLDEINRELASRHLSEFIQLLWRQIDPGPFVPGWHIDVICAHLEAVSRGEIRKLLITVPPRHMKSISVSVAWPAWVWAQDAEGVGGPLQGPGTRFLFASYARSLSVRDSVKCRRLIQSPPYRRAWGHRYHLTSDQGVGGWSPSRNTKYFSGLKTSKKQQIILKYQIGTTETHFGV